MVANFVDAISAYRKATAIPTETAGVGSASPSAGGGFADILQQVAGNAVDGLNAAEHATKMGVLGKMSPVDIATAVAGAETTLQMMVTLRDKMIGAYQEITRMGV